LLFDRRELSAFLNSGLCMVSKYCSARWYTYANPSRNSLCANGADISFGCHYYWESSRMEKGRVKGLG